MSEPPPQPKSGKMFTVVVVVLVLALVVGLAYWGVRRRQASQAGAMARTGPPVVPVVVAPVVEKDVPIYLDGLGTVMAFNTVTVRVRVDGQLKKVAFTEGQDVKAGDVLAEIDPDPFRTALDQAKAKKGQDEAQVANAKADLKRETDLFAAKIDSEQVYATQKALVDQLDALVNADQAAIESAQVQLNYTTVASPIDGRTGIRQVDQGNIVHATDTNGLVVITQLKPISISFTLPEQDLEEIHKQMALTNTELKALAVGRDNKTILGEGKLAVIDNQIDTTTGTIRLKATFPNENLALWPGQFVNVRLLVSVRKNGLTVPSPAIQRGPNGAYVFVIGKGGGKPGGRGTGGKSSSGQMAANGAMTDANNSDSTNAPAGTLTTAGSGQRGGKGDTNQAPILSVRIQNVTVATQVEAGEALIDSGLQKGQRVVVDGQYKLQDGSSVRISTDAKPGDGGSASKDTVQ